MLEAEPEVQDRVTRYTDGRKILDRIVSRIDEVVDDHPFSRAVLTADAGV